MTPSLGLLLTTCVLMAAPAKEEDPAARAQATLQRVSKLPLEHQRVWLRLIEQRYGWAVLLTLKPEDARREQARVAKILHQKTVAWNDLIALLRELDQREKAAISRLVRQYRSEVYETFRKQPRDMVDRQEAWYRIWSLWEKAGSPPEQQDRLMDWLADAIKASTKDSISPLPADPKFAGDAELVPEQLVKQLTQPPAAKPNGTSTAAPRQPTEDSLPRPTLQARWPLPLRVPDSRRVIGPTKRPSEAVVVRRVENIVWLPLSAVAPPAVVPPMRIVPPVAADDPKELTTPPAPPHEAIAVIVRREARIAAESSAEAVAQAEPAAARPQAIGPRRHPSDMPPPRMVESPPLEQPLAALAPVAAGPRAISPRESAASEPENSRQRGLQQDVAAQLPHQPAEFTAPRSEQPEEYRVERKPLGPEVAAGQTPPPSLPAAQTQQHAQVNVEELRTRIEGINLSLRNLEAELHEKRDFAVDQLDSLLSRLDILVLRQKDLSLFRDLVAPQEQAKVGQIDSSRSVVATMGTRIAELRTRIRENEAMPEAERTAALKHLDELSDRLATMTAEK
ncbi:MAG: hypothetical protein ACLP9L_39150 [Thermoguttaceae bacterium]